MSTAISAPRMPFIRVAPIRIRVHSNVDSIVRIELHGHVRRHLLPTTIISVVIMCVQYGRAISLQLNAIVASRPVRIGPEVDSPQTSSSYIHGVAAYLQVPARSVVVLTIQAIVRPPSPAGV